MRVVVVLVHPEEAGLHIAVGQEGAGLGIDEELVDERGGPEVLRAVERQEREVGVVVASGDAVLAGRSQMLGIVEADERVGDAVGGGGVGVEAVRVGGGQDACEPVVADREVIDELAGERKVLPAVVAEREVVVAAAPEPVARPAVQLDPSAVVGVGRIFLTRSR